jgi:hypothetical protein
MIDLKQRMKIQDDYSQFNKKRNILTLFCLPKHGVSTSSMLSVCSEND